MRMSVLPRTLVSTLIQSLEIWSNYIDLTQ
jgi:hypothetical protein